eukprot:5523352-Prymnesium_polylepis.2
MLGRHTAACAGQLSCQGATRACCTKLRGLWRAVQCSHLPKEDEVEQRIGREEQAARQHVLLGPLGLDAVRVAPERGHLLPEHCARTHDATRA